jgi:hypothetical protein
VVNSAAVVAASVQLPLISQAGATQSPSIFATAEFQNTFDGGTDGVTVSTANSGGASGNAWDAVATGVGATRTYNAANALHGAFAEAIDPANATGVYTEWRETTIGTRSEWYGRFYIKLSALPSTSIVIFNLRDSVTAVDRSLLSVQSSGAIRISGVSGVTLATSTSLLTAGAWSRVEFHWVGDPTVGSFEAKLFNTVESATPTQTISATGANTGGTIDRMRIGQAFTSGSDIPVFYLDQIALSTVAYIGPYVASAQTITAGLISNAGSTLAPSIGWNVGLPLISQAGATASPAISNAGSGQAITLPLIATGWDQQPWDSAWGGTGAATLAPTITLQVLATLISHAGAVQIATVNPGSVSLPLITIATATLNPFITQQVEPSLIDQSGAPQAVVSVGSDLTVELPLISQPGAIQIATVNSQTVIVPLIDNAGFTLNPTFNQQVVAALINQAGATLFAPLVGRGLGNALIDNAGATLSATINQRVEPALISQAGATQSPDIVDAVERSITLPLIDQSGATLDIFNMAFGDPTEVGTSLLSYGHTLFARVYQPLPAFIFKKALYRPTIHKKALYRPTIYKKARTEGMSITQNITLKDGFFTGEDQSVIWEANTPSGSPPDTTGWTIQFRMATTPTGASVVTKSATVTDEILEVIFAAADTSSLTPGKYYYTLSRTDSGSNHVNADGSIVLRARVS